MTDSNVLKKLFTFNAKRKEKVKIKEKTLN